MSITLHKETTTHVKMKLQDYNKSNLLDEQTHFVFSTKTILVPVLAAQNDMQAEK